MTDNNSNNIDVNQFIKKCDDPRQDMPKVALPPHLKSFRTAHVSKAGLTPLGQVIKPGAARYAGQDANGKTLPPKSSSRPTLLNKRAKLK
ncbi:hypothetical protein FWH09_02160 [Candidatus Saccharibacteria bacterium]|nr:hypothetical protein [Candidatus Saccharibacteria bacterium]